MQTIGESLLAGHGNGSKTFPGCFLVGVVRHVTPALFDTQVTIIIMTEIPIKTYDNFG